MIKSATSVLAAVAVLSLAACGSSGGASSSTAKQQLALMAGVPSPPQQIAANWTAWKSYLSLVLTDSAKPGAGSSLASTLSGPTTKVESSRTKLENYAFAHCS
ncbi:hypothetical protein [uncultured Jatrophihabitans sp.]|uniref:hypothetical protein n=1 Tax=uncultured Jatrophihabitans sp. TaxID=1610747 RepID=UPI0035CC5189